MSALLVDDIAQHIRIVDGGNKMSPYDLGTKVADYLYRKATIDADRLTPVVHFVSCANPDKRMGAGRLAELIVAEFDLDKEQ